MILFKTNLNANDRGLIRYNSELDQFEGYGAGNAWGSLGGVKDVDGDTFIRAESAAGEDEDVLEFLTGNSTRLVRDSTGKVGIGSTLPTAKLDVNGTLNVSGVSTFQDNVHLGDNDVLKFGDHETPLWLLFNALILISYSKNQS